MPSEKIKNSLTLVEDDLHALYTNFTDNLILPTSGTRTSSIYLSWVCWFCSRKSAIFHYTLTWLLQEVVVAIKNKYCKAFYTDDSMDTWAILPVVQWKGTKRTSQAVLLELDSAHQPTRWIDHAFCLQEIPFRFSEVYSKNDNFRH